MNIIGTCIDCFPACSSFLLTCGVATAALGLAIYRSMAGHATGASWEAMGIRQRAA